MIRYRISPAAAADLRGILRSTVERFGTQQHGVYRALILDATARVAVDPFDPSSRDRSDIGRGIRSFPIARAARRRSAAAHVLFYRSDPSGVLILRVLHESMDPAAHIGDTPP